MQANPEEVAALRRVIQRRDEDVMNLRLLCKELFRDRDPRWLPLKGKLRRIAVNHAIQELLADDIRRQPGYLNEEERSALRNLLAPAILSRGDDAEDVRDASERLIQAVEELIEAHSAMLGALTGDPHQSTPRLADSLHGLLVEVLDRHGQDLDHGLCSRIEDALGAP